ncbi:hypothetical protein KP509_1Z316500 [Ceratopteris richardii]|nr:hypothetical protein KP509_1Z316500 [Ceratopteris richardii]
MESVLSDLQRQLARKQNIEKKRAATLLKTRYTAVGFWMVGLRLFEETLKVVTNPEEKETQQAERGSRFLFEGQLTVDPEPPRPAWLVAQNLLSRMSERHWQSNATLGQTSTTEAPNSEQLVTNDIEELLQQMTGFTGSTPGLEEASAAEDLSGASYFAPPFSLNDSEL